MATAIATSHSANRAFQFRLATLLIAMVWAGLVSLALRTPTELWSGVIAALMLLSIFMAVLLAIYRTGRTRATSIGFLVFCVGYLAYLTTSSGNLGNGLSDTSTALGATFATVFEKIHPARNVNIPFGTGRITVPPFHPGHFLTICNQAFASILGVIGAVVAQVLYATQRHTASGNER
jgi:hypothetical protein